jgi:hypothetical protein
MKRERKRKGLGGAIVRASGGRRACQTITATESPRELSVGTNTIVAVAVFTFGEYARQGAVTYVSASAVCYR